MNKNVEFAMDNREKLPLFEKIRNFIENDLKEIYPSKINEVDLWILNLRMYDNYYYTLATYYGEYMDLIDHNSKEKSWEVLTQKILSDIYKKEE